MNCIPGVSAAVQLITLGHETTTKIRLVSAKPALEHIKRRLMETIDFFKRHMVFMTVVVISDGLFSKTPGVLSVLGFVILMAD